ncbi:glycoside hydrolase superfamily [Infundibulicybe gibba]|nr:glycoside hydrolase superfamily [Infundibulicybe gibba]
MKASFIALAALVIPTLAANHFTGINVANSRSGASYACRTPGEVNKWRTIANNARNNGFDSIRVPGFDCDALNLASAAAAAAGIQVMAGIWVESTIAAGAAKIDADVQKFLAACQKYGVGRYAGLTIGNEVKDSASSIMNKVASVRGYLRSAGVSTPVSTVHIWVNIRDSAVFCSGDFIGANAHTYFDGARPSNEAGKFLLDTVIPSLKSRCPGKKIIITESGWPSRGSALGTAKVSVADSRAALRNLNCAAGKDKSVSIYAFEYDDQTWKEVETERSFGIFGKFNVGTDILSSC